MKTFHELNQMLYHGVVSIDSRIKRIKANTPKTRMHGSVLVTKPFSIHIEGFKVDLDELRFRWQGVDQANHTIKSFKRAAEQAGKQWTKQFVKKLETYHKRRVKKERRD